MRTFSNIIIGCMQPITKITLTGDLGSGKSATSKILCQETGFSYLSTGQIQRKLAAELGMDTLEMNRKADSDPSIDEKIDSVFIGLNQTEEGYIVDSRLAWHFLPQSFKVYLAVDPIVAVTRIMSDPGRNSEQYESAEEAVAKIQARKESENARFLLKYGVDCGNLENYDLLIDTTNRPPSEVADLILQAWRAKAQGSTFLRSV